MANPTITDIARLAGVSTATVSRYLNNPEIVVAETQARIRLAIEETGFSPNSLAQNFRKGKTNVVMVVVPEIGNSFFMEIVEGVRSVLNPRFSLLLTEARDGLDEPTSCVDMLLSRQIEGMILLATLNPLGERLERSSGGRGLPIVIGLEPISDDLMQLPSVHIDNFAAAMEATQYLLDAGHQRIAFVSGAKGSFITHDRELGFREALVRANVSLPDDYVLYSDLTPDGGVAAGDVLLGSELPPTAIFCANDDMAIGVMHSARARGLTIPDDLSVIGFDDTRYARLSNPPLTTIAQPARRIGVQTAIRLLNAIDSGADNKGTEYLDYQFIIRDSVRSLVLRK